MTALAIDSTWISPEAYLAAEAKSTTKHEYINGNVYVMADAQNIHNRLTGNVNRFLGNRLSGRKCQPYNSDTKVRVRLPSSVRFYYPDAQVVCNHNGWNESHQDHPAVIVEVLSDSTERTDRSEKWEAYQAIPTLEHYLLVDSSHIFVTAFQRTVNGFERTEFRGKDAVIKLDCIEIELPLAEIYEGTNLPALEVVK